MKKPIISFVFLLFTLSGCSTKNSETTPEEVYVEKISSGLISSAGTSRVRLDGTTGIVYPFNTSEIIGNVYCTKNQYSDKELESINEEFKFYLQYYSALVDRHYDYKLYDSADDKSGASLNNVKKINDSYGTETQVVVDEFLYDVLKASYEFTLQSDGKFNMFLGTLNDLYETKLKTTNVRNMTALDFALTCSNGFGFNTDFDEQEIQTAVKFLPTTKEEITGLLSFDDSQHSVVFHKLAKVTNSSYAPQISLGGNGKGYAIQKLSEILSEKHPGISMLINAGHSSIKTVGKKPTSSPWKIRYTNPVYRESFFGNSSYASEEVGLEVQNQFNLSTSAYYEQYFYVYDKSQDAYLRRTHIVNPETGYSKSFFDQVSVLNDNAGLADMYTTALMNTDSVNEAVSLYKKLNSYYHETDSDLILCYKSLPDDPTSLYQYKNSELSHRSEYDYPTMKKTSDGTIYSGNYTDMTAQVLYNEYATNSLPSRQFKETYYMTSNAYKNHIDIESDGEKLAVVKEISE